jgi:malate synthase
MKTSPTAVAAAHPQAELILTPDALAFLAELNGRFTARRDALLAARAERQARLDAGETLDFDPATRDIRESEWRVPKAPPALRDRRVEITGPVERKMMINALNSGARVFLADCEDALSPTWSRVVDGQANLLDEIDGALEYTGPDGREYRLADETATIVMRPRGWHLDEAHVTVDGRPLPGALVDFGLAIFHGGARRLEAGTGPYFYLPKLESGEEAALWHDVFCFAEDALGLGRGAIRATVLIETIPAAFQMDEILHALGEHATGLNAGRWDYIFSIIKRFRDRPQVTLADRAQVTMTVPFMRAYTELLVRTCHRRGAHAIGGMAALVPSRKNPEQNERAVAGVRADKEREAADGFDGTWVAHPDLVPVAQAAFDAVLGDRPNQLHRLREDVRVGATDLLDLRVPGGSITDAGLRNNVAVSIEYLASWLNGSGAVAINGLMEDAATAEIARAQLWAWVRHGAATEDGTPISIDRVRSVVADELDRLRREGPPGLRYDDAAALVDELVSAPDCAPPEFLTVPGYARLER